MILFLLTIIIVSVLAVRDFKDGKIRLGIIIIAGILSLALTGLIAIFAGTLDEYKKHLIRMCIALTRDDNIYRLSPEGILENRRLLFDIMNKLYTIDNEENY